MKTIILVYTTAFLAGTASTITMPEPSATPTVVEKRSVNSIFNFVHAHRQGKGATVAWSSAATPSTVTGFSVIRTYEDPTDPYAEWNVVNSYGCTFSRNYKCTENTVSPGFVSYKVIATLTDNSVVESEVRTVHIVQH